MSSREASSEESQSVLDLVARLRSEGSGLSRNRNFEMFEATNARRALRLHRRLRRLERDLLRYVKRKGKINVRAQAHAQAEGHVRNSGSPGAPRRGARNRNSQQSPKTLIVIEVHEPSIRLKRKIFLDRRELMLLCDRPELERLLAPGLEQAP